MIAAKKPNTDPTWKLTAIVASHTKFIANATEASTEISWSTLNDPIKRMLPVSLFTNVSTAAARIGRSPSTTYPIVEADHRCTNHSAFPEIPCTRTAYPGVANATSANKPATKSKMSRRVNGPMRPAPGAFGFLGPLAFLPTVSGIGTPGLGPPKPPACGAPPKPPACCGAEPYPGWPPCPGLGWPGCCGALP